MILLVIAILIYIILLLVLIVDYLVSEHSKHKSVIEKVMNKEVKSRFGALLMIIVSIVFVIPSAIICMIMDCGNIYD